MLRQEKAEQVKYNEDAINPSTLNENNDEHPIKLLFEPITLTAAAIWVLKGLGAGVLSAIGSEMYTRVTGGTNKMEVAIRKMADETKRYIQNAIDYRDIFKLSKLAEKIKTMHLDYINAPADDRLHILTNDVDTLLSESKNEQSLYQGINTHELYIFAVGAKLLILREREKRFPDNARGEKLNGWRLINEARIYIGNVTQQLMETSQSIFRRNQDFDRHEAVFQHSLKILGESDSPNPEDQPDTVYGALKKHQITLDRELRNGLKLSPEEEKELERKEEKASYTLSELIAQNNSPIFSKEQPQTTPSLSSQYSPS